ncbi:hypothetical protein N7520_008924 [Penicillium odoratum]|uniref:uncharacterized protein n=1 Tax=Penicillium odoratum TaxID=1167516 RepID=UPI00254854E4|nr:uncharacterized protein N7520_008924 [Penicillium odoratum]KAJ5752007.1 hypothetical protein N7520_008924 [Penicillium odoratum]
MPRKAGRARHRLRRPPGPSSNAQAPSNTDAPPIPTPTADAEVNNEGRSTTPTEEPPQTGIPVVNTPVGNASANPNTTYRNLNLDVANNPTAFTSEYDEHYDGYKNAKNLGIHEMNCRECNMEDLILKLQAVSLEYYHVNRLYQEEKRKNFTMRRGLEARLPDVEMPVFHGYGSYYY